MPNISATPEQDLLVKQLRNELGCTYGNAKRALRVNEWDYQLALEYMKEKGW